MAEMKRLSPKQIARMTPEDKAKYESAMSAIDAAEREERISKKASTVTGLQAFARGLGQGASFGLMDEAHAGLDALLGKGEYSERLKKYQEDLEAAEIGQPGAFRTADVLSSIPAFALPGGAAIRGVQVASKGAKVAQGLFRAGLFATEGAASAAARAKEGERSEAAKFGASTGLISGMLGNTVINSIAKYLPNRVKVAMRGDLGLQNEQAAKNVAADLAEINSKYSNPKYYEEVVTGYADSPVLDAAGKTIKKPVFEKRLKQEYQIQKDVAIQKRLSNYDQQLKKNMEETPGLKAVAKNIADVGVDSALARQAVFNKVGLIRKAATGAVALPGNIARSGLTGESVPLVTGGLGAAGPAAVGGSLYEE